jgi:CheY-like chemotaxis protein
MGMNDKVLFVDDEPAVLDGYRRMLRQEFALDTADGGERGLAAMVERGPFALVISDMRMPGMDGVQFLSRAMQIAPDTVRMVLTGYADLEAVMHAVNEGNIFRFLTKPCDKEKLARAITTGLVQHHLITAEKELLENTLMGSIKVLTDVLSLVNPEAFGRSMRITRCVRHLVAKFKLGASWRFEAAAMLSQLGCVALDPEVIEAASRGSALSPEDQKRFDNHPRIARDLLINIPRLEPIAWMIGQQAPGDRAEEKKIPQADSLAPEVLAFGAKILKTAIAFDDLATKGVTQEAAITWFYYRLDQFDRELVDALKDLEPEGPKMQSRVLSIWKLTPGMILQQEVRTHTGVLVVGKGQEVSHPLMVRLESFAQRHAIEDKVMVLVPS